MTDPTAAVARRLGHATRRLTTAEVGGRRRPSRHSAKPQCLRWETIPRRSTRAWPRATARPCATSSRSRMITSSSTTAAVRRHLASAAASASQPAALLTPELACHTHLTTTITDGAVPKVVAAYHHSLSERCERNPDRWIGEYRPLVADSRAMVAEMIGARTEDVVMVENASTGARALISTVFRPFPDQLWSVLTHRRQHRPPPSRQYYRQKHPPPQLGGDQSDQY